MHAVDEGEEEGEEKEEVEVEVFAQVIMLYYQPTPHTTNTLIILQCSQNNTERISRVLDNDPFNIFSIEV